MPSATLSNSPTSTPPRTNARSSLSTIVFTATKLSPEKSSIPFSTADELEEDRPLTTEETVPSGHSSRLLSLLSVLADGGIGTGVGERSTLNPEDRTSAALAEDGPLISSEDIAAQSVKPPTSPSLVSGTFWELEKTENPIRSLPPSPGKSKCWPTKALDAVVNIVLPSKILAGCVFRSQENRVKEYYSVLYDCSAAADDPDEIFFHQGDIVEFIEKQDQEWSLVRKSDGSVGIAPSNNLEYTASTQFGSNKATASSSALVLDSAAATVCHEFIPFLSDELQVAIGEEVRVLSEYDDGWALCKNDHGDQGMVPLECLNRGAGAQTQQARTPDHKSRRTSSMRGFQLVSGDRSTNLSDPSTAPSELVSPNDYKYKAKARLSYDPPASDKEGLSFRKDEILDVVDTAGKKWKARRTDGSTGIVPSYYFHII